ncbi:MAG: NADH-quinone oxidoreductase subunit NuoE [Candidatus Schekmanbacteria bacterium]|nr:NADH-quinone oxidoreductase subunit NuoE [Candidatus Schekmanbacteria bacterium]
MNIPQPLWQEIEQIIVSYPQPQGAVLPALHKIQERMGYLAEEALAQIAGHLRIPQVDLFEIATFYTLLYTRPHGDNIILVCNNISCYILDSETILSTLEDELKIKAGNTTADNKFTLQAVSCLGACDGGPVMLINDQLYPHLTGDKIRRILKEY